MIFEEMYLKCFDLLCRYCLVNNGGNRYLAEEAAKKALDVMARKWGTVQYYGERQLMTWLLGVANNTMLEVGKDQPTKWEPLDEPWCVELVEKQQIGRGEPLDEETEHLRFLDYAAAVERELEGWERELFHYRVVDGLLFKDVGKRMHITENAAKLRWYRLEEKLKSIVNKMLISK